MKAKKEIMDWLEEIESDERLHYKPADILVNAPLALIQVEMETTSAVLRKILGLALCRHNEKTGKWEIIK